MLIDSDVCYLALGHDTMARQQVYAQWVMGAEVQDEAKLIRTALTRGQLTGPGRFVDEVEERIGLRIEQRGPGRP